MAKSIDAFYFRLVNAESARVLANGEELFRKYGAPAGKWVVSSVISEKEIASVTRDRPSQAPFRILYVGYLRRWKGLDVLFAAFRALCTELPNAELCIVGQADLQEQVAADSLRSEVLDLEQKGLVRFVGHVPFGADLFQHFADADVLILPSKGVEGTPRVLIEARAFGCPVIATDVGGVRSTIDHDVDGLIIPPNDVEACRSALLRVAREPELRRQLIDNGLRRARACTVESFARDVIHELKVLAKEMPSPSLQPV